MSRKGIGPPRPHDAACKPHAHESHSLVFRTGVRSGTQGAARARDDLRRHRALPECRLGAGSRLGAQQELLLGERFAARIEQEGVRVEDNRVVEFERLFWDPSVELGYEEE